MPLKKSIISACVATVALAGCSAGSPSAGSSAAASARATRTASVFTVSGVHPVLPNGSQDTHAQTPGSVCDSTKFASDEVLGTRIADGFVIAGFPVAADLLRHFLQGKGTEVDYPAGSQLSREALASSAFRSVDNEVQAAVLGQLKAGKTHVRLSVAQLPTVAFESTTSDLYWGFRGTQGLTVTGWGSRVNGRYEGTLSYLIRDSYGFPVGDTLDGFGPPMRYLQTVCGAPQHAGGARWFSDSIAVTVGFGCPGGRVSGC